MIALAGLSGAGKTTLLKDISKETGAVHLSASSLIKEQMIFENGCAATSEGLRAGNISDNQLLLSRAFRRQTMELESHVFLDCHTVIDTPAGLQELSPSVFEALGLTDFAFLLVEPEVLAQRRRNDIVRSRPERTEEEISFQQKAALQVGRNVANVIGVPFTILTDHDARKKLVEWIR
jgi:adenylate kinase